MHGENMKLFSCIQEPHIWQWSMHVFAFACVCACLY